MFSWFSLAWPWIGLGFAVVLIVLLCTNLLRSNRALPRWRDLRWLSFLAVVVYMLHNVEEYGLAADGVVHAFPDTLCRLVGQPPYPECAIPETFYLAVNLPLVWIAAPLAAVLFNRIGLAALTMWGVIAVNALVHIGPAIALRQYDPGLLTAVILFVPLTVLTAHVALGRQGPYRRRAGAVLLAAGVLMHGVLGGSAVLFLDGAIPEWVFLAAQPFVVAVGYLIVGIASRGLLKPLE